MAGGGGGYPQSDSPPPRSGEWCPYLSLARRGPSFLTSPSSLGLCDRSLLGHGLGGGGLIHTGRTEWDISSSVLVHHTTCLIGENYIRTCSRRESPRTSPVLIVTSFNMVFSEMCNRRLINSYRPRTKYDERLHFSLSVHIWPYCYSLRKRYASYVSGRRTFLFLVAKNFGRTVSPRDSSTTAFLTVNISKPN